jgi:hypothetical protein
MAMQQELTVNTFTDRLFVKGFFNLYGYAGNDFVKAKLLEKRHEHAGDNENEYNNAHDHLRDPGKNPYRKGLAPAYRVNRFEYDEGDAQAKEPAGDKSESEVLPCQARKDPDRHARGEGGIKRLAECRVANPGKLCPDPDKDRRDRGCGYDAAYDEQKKAEAGKLHWGSPFGGDGTSKLQRRTFVNHIYHGAQTFPHRGGINPASACIISARGFTFLTAVITFFKTGSAEGMQGFKTAPACTTTLIISLGLLPGLLDCGYMLISIILMYGVYRCSKLR